MVRLCGAALGLLAFGVTIFLGLAAGNPTESILLKAVWALMLFCGIGLFVGWVSHRVMDEHALRLDSEARNEEDAAAEASADQTDAMNQGEIPAAAGDQAIT
jgi:NhaP-type Na+/H+ or K+/H+ antiporter